MPRGNTSPKKRPSSRTSRKTKLRNMPRRKNRS